MEFVQAPPAPPGPTSAGKPNAATLPTSPDVCSSLHPLGGDGAVSDASRMLRTEQTREAEAGAGHAWVEETASLGAGLPDHLHLAVDLRRTVAHAGLVGNRHAAEETRTQPAHGAGRD